MELPTVTLASVAPSFFARSKQYDALILNILDL